jgi:hypothetical protein
MGVGGQCHVPAALSPGKDPVRLLVDCVRARRQSTKTYSTFQLSHIYWYLLMIGY